MGRRGPLPKPPELPSQMYRMPLATIGLVQCVCPIWPVQRMFPVVGSIACSSWIGFVVVCSPPPSEAKLYTLDTFKFEDYAILKEFRGRHPRVMEARVAAARRFASRRSRWLNWRFYREVVQRGFRG